MKIDEKTANPAETCARISVVKKLYVHEIAAIKNILSEKHKENI